MIWYLQFVGVTLYSSIMAFGAETAARRRAAEFHDARMTSCMSLIAEFVVLNTDQRSLSRCGH